MLTGKDHERNFQNIISPRFSDVDFLSRNENKSNYKVNLYQNQIKRHDRNEYKVMLSHELIEDGGAKPIVGKSKESKLPVDEREILEQKRQSDEYSYETEINSFDEMTCPQCIAFADVIANVFLARRGVLKKMG